ncbi:D-alanyl-D-alanine carboxypeptidase [Paenibacillus sp. UNC496MF]|uniref:M15 family metallopeptidase n=1 Tax=Paenibacillus sp. UNC496MF TaxID=1502753 RepID=UPI0008E96784|nr:M15 family metallopeptidase [Paenibacillus sp. UNC496MF]SFJ22422.1 D-alanyl-D-alanine carboxypeptidase [Paenibacillus sp. UNC496MF]
MKATRLAALVVLAVVAVKAGQHAKGWFAEPEGKAAAADAAPMSRIVQTDADQPYRGDLVLVDRTHPVREAGRLDDVVNLFEHPELKHGYGLMDTTVSLSKRVAEKWQVLADAARADGIRHFVINSGYRDEAAQKKLYAEKGSDYALPPGYSEHNLGLSMDVGSTTASMNAAPEGNWLSKHAWAYGFILRYPEDKTAVTGIQFEPWHFRYVGLPHSVIMHDRGWTLEEYLAALKEQHTLTALVDGVSYEVDYYTASPSGETAISVPADGAYTVSGDNDDGIIVTSSAGGEKP